VWSERQLVDGTIVLTSPSGRVYPTKPSGGLSFPQPGEALGPAEARPNGPRRTLAMPVRRRTRTAERAARIEWERGVNRTRIAANPLQV
jgi:hypothetical protein